MCLIHWWWITWLALVAPPGEWITAPSGVLHGCECDAWLSMYHSEKHMELHKQIISMCFIGTLCGCTRVCLLPSYISIALACVSSLVLVTRTWCLFQCNSSTIVCDARFHGYHVVGNQLVLTTVFTSSLFVILFVSHGLLKVLPQKLACKFLCYVFQT